jgi:hypothetical protein
MKLLSDKHSLYLFILLVATDLVFIAIGMIYECGFTKLADICVAINLDSYFSITRDRGYAEVFQYIKEYWLILLFAFLTISRSVRAYLGWFFFSIYLFLDDALEIHENIGAAIGNNLHFIRFLKLRPEDYGELAVFIIVGTVFFLWLSISYRLGNSEERAIFKSLIRLLFGLAIFAIVIDVIHIILDNYVFWKSSLAIVEDGGEHIMMSLIVCYVWLIATKTSQSIAMTSKKKIAYTRH